MPTRNPQLTINGMKIQTVGDIHLGRKYHNGVPIHMRGQMEKLQREKFTELLSTGGVEGFVLVGDTFDSYIVDPADVEFAASGILGAARGNPDIWFVVLGGNHDESKDTTKKSSFDLFKLIIKEANLDNIHLIEKPTVFKGMGFISWSATYSAKELAEQLVSSVSVSGSNALAAVFGHWDVVLPSNANHYNMVPTEQLKAVTQKIVTGHVHRPDTVERDGIEITLTGSILPLSHGEEIDSDEMFYTVTKDEYEADPKKYERKFVRFVLNEDEELPEGDFLQVKAYVKPSKTSLDEGEVATEFDISKILKAYLIKNDVPEARTIEVVERFDAKQDRD